jgi:flagellin
LKNVDITPEGLGLQSAEGILRDSQDAAGIDLQSARDMLQTDDDSFSSAYDKALSTLSTHRAVFGGMQERLNRALEFNDVFAENIAAAKSKIADTDYAAEVTRMAQNNILVQATTGLIAQNNISSSMALGLIASAIKN